MTSKTSQSRIPRNTAETLQKPLRHALSRSPREAAGKPGQYSSSVKDLSVTDALNRLKALPVAERPRERLLREGAERMSDQELLALVLGSGTRTCSLGELTRAVLDLFDRRGDMPRVEDLLVLKGLGSAKAATLSAACEFARRVYVPRGRRIRVPADVLPVVQHYADRKQELFIAVSLNGAHEVIASRVISIGLVNRTLVHPREVYADAVVDRAAALVAAHNPPSGRVEPSSEDREVTRKLAQAGETLGIRLLDHIVFTTDAYYSFLENAEL